MLARTLYGVLSFTLCWPWMGLASFRNVENWRNGGRLGASLRLLGACLFFAQFADIRDQIIDLRPQLVRLGLFNSVA